MSYDSDSGQSKTTHKGLGLDSETMRLIHEVMQQDHIEPPQPAGRLRASALSSLDLPDEEDTSSKAAPRLPFDMSKLFTPRRLAIAVILIAVWMQPWFIPTVLLCLAALVGVTLLIFGRERCGNVSARLWSFYANRNPDKAERIRKRVDARRARFQRRLDKLAFLSGPKPHAQQWQAEESEAAAERAYARRMRAIHKDARHNPYAS